MTAFLEFGQWQRHTMLSGGRAAVYWQRNLAQLASRRVGLARACAWVTETVDADVPRLQPGPLLGYCLAELLDTPEREPPAAESPAQTARTRATAVTNTTHKKRSGIPPGNAHLQHAAASESLAQNKQISMVTPSQSPSGRRSPAVPEPSDGKQFEFSTGGWHGKHADHGQLPLTSGQTQVTQDLLNRLAGKTAVTSSAFSSPQKRSERQRLSVSQKHTTLAAKATMIETETTAQQQAQRWHSKLIQRTHEHTWQTGKDVWSSASRAETPAQFAAALETEWQRPLAGECMAAHALNMVVQRAQKSITKHNNDRQSNVGMHADSYAGHEQAVTNTQPAPTASSTAFGQQKRPLRTTQSHQPESSLTQTLRARYNAAGKEAAPFSNGGLMTKKKVDSPTLADPTLAPPRMAADLPPLQPTQRPYDANMPVATALAQHSARHEAAAVPADLDNLARQIKQILDEESRRYGIDV